MKEKNAPDAFSRCHPAVLLLFFLFAMLFGMVLQHPAYIAAGLCASALYALYLAPRKAARFLLSLFPLLAVIAAVNPLFNTLGEHPLFYIGARPYTREALLCGASVAGMFGTMALWFYCMSIAVTADKLTALFAGAAPTLSLLFVMVLHLIPELRRRTERISCARACIGKDPPEGASLKTRIETGGATLLAVTLVSLEGAIQTADSMRSRGYGAARRTSFARLRLTRRDGVLCALLFLCAALFLCSALTGGTQAQFFPLAIAPVAGAKAVFSLAGYALALLLPVLTDIWEDLQWRFSIYNI